MTSVRIRTFAAGAAIAVIAGILVDHGAAFGAAFTKTALLGVAAGAVLALVPHRSFAGRAGGFVAGLAAAWFGYALRAGVLPDIPLGRALAAVAVISLITAVATASADRLPLWSGLVGAGTMIGAYEATYTATPAAFTGESGTATSTVLLAAAFGYVVTLLVAVTAPQTQASQPVGVAPAPEHAPRDDHDNDGFVDAAAILPAPRVVDDAPVKDGSTR
jgi:hypothetical protein